MTGCKCEFCGHYPSYTAGPGIACLRCTMAGVGDPRSGAIPPKPRTNLEAQDLLVEMVPRVEPELTADMRLVERILAVFSYNVCEVQ